MKATFLFGKEETRLNGRGVERKQLEEMGKVLKKTQSGAWSSVRLGGLGPYASSTFSTSTGKESILDREPKVDETRLKGEGPTGSLIGERWKKRLGMDLGVFVRAVCGPTHPICSMIYGSTGATHFDQLAKIFTGYEMTGAPSSGLFMGILFIAVGFLFKITAVPFHMWSPDIYEGSPNPVTTFLSIAPKISISANTSRLSIYGSYGATLQQIFFFCSIASMILGALAAMAQTKVKRLLAHSSIGHVGYICTGFSCGTIEGIQSLLIGLFIYASITINAFAIVPALRQTRVKYIADLGALAKTNPILAITFSITMFSYAGIPPLAGFCSKFYLFFAALGCGAYFLASVGIVTSVIGCFYYIRLVKRMFFDTPRTWILYEPMDRNKSLLLAMTSSFITSSFPYPSPLFSVTHQMALSSYL
ncbi:hypothetical protein C5167_027748 [Papaver somniferum]|nr:hypothetical protein C5167_027748 [Papaver somniferum]